MRETDRCHTQMLGLNERECLIGCEHAHQALAHPVNQSWHKSMPARETHLTKSWRNAFLREA
jgi:hypothetical protein